MAETLHSLPQLATKSQPSMIETSMNGLKKPFDLKDMELFEKSRTAQAMQAVKERFYRTRMNGQTKFTTQEALDYLYANQAGTHYPELVHAVLKGFLTLTDSVVDHGGGTRRLCSPPISDEPTDDSFPAFFRWKREELLGVKFGNSEIPNHETMAAKVITNLSHPHNMDWKAAVDPKDLPKFAAASQKSILQFLKERKFKHTVHEAEDRSFVEIHIDDVVSFWHDIPVLGLFCPKGNASTNERYAFYFGPQEKPDTFVIRIGLIHPQANPNMTNLHVAMGPAKNNEFVDLREIYFSPKPTTENGRLPHDHRDGLVDDRQGKLCAVYKRDGVTLPDYIEYQKHQARIQPETWPKIENDINRLISLLGRLIRYSNHTATPWTIDLMYGYPSMMPDTMDDIYKITDSICQLIEKGEQISDFKIEEFLGNIIVAVHNSNNHLATILKRLRSNKDRKLLKQADSIVTMHAREPLSSNQSDGLKVIHYEESGETTWTSGISKFLMMLHEDVQQYVNEHHEQNRALLFDPKLPPNGSLLAQLLWILEPRNN